ncbi:gp54 [Rhodococcus phage ReqiPine5]|uniref:Gp54 n=1 Tax=Rhodococcus phage ReqiPine5 TaxID=691963 RepID=D4P829_9CAUD|nr:gp54 [Rhodococcus phage ReqiPine5]ADD81159.1 gp54 [Rhodococcus phage ReqiPine5]
MTHTVIGGRSFAIVHRGQPGHFTQGATILHAELGTAGRHLYVIEELSTCPDSEDVFTYVVMTTKVDEAEIENLLIASEDIDPVNVECSGYVLNRASLGIIVEALFRSYDIANLTEGTDR